ncbi:Hypothetical Protein RradSPS_2482 [Rubrobacter radiotolerans]|uniref:DUF6328 family protein n=1 Tax=Rubrobacter radiotolerans TaxID=42256 RepID=A0A023X6W7_RUBRA|nr:DUF6328 family protein [Rubrobacter radiotolerans]AHY47765.1 Hypothetical Protein RradSPS_2482 [Rubrobacter radiotolerans]MDX5892404.1 DUF6328 family protein [Rubrobacter radiotolerans]SMC07695.1 Protein of unknown function [Rubrobacter radiotolerans DSM 5868]
MDRREGETQREREIRNMDELLQELRVVLPGVQVLFAFLLVVVFSERFDEVSALQRGVYLAALLCTTLAAALLIAPTAQHRVLWRQGARAQRLRIANGLAILGTAFLAAGMGCAIFLVTDVIYGSLAAAVVTGVVVAVFVGLWYALPLYQRLRRR